MSWNEIMKVLSQFDDERRPTNNDIVELSNLFGAQLGLASTRELLDEIIARLEVDGILEYRTVPR